MIGKYIDNYRFGGARRKRPSAARRAQSPALGAHKFYAQLAADMGNAGRRSYGCSQEADPNGNDPEYLLGLSTCVVLRAIRAIDRRTRRG